MTIGWVSGDVVVTACPRTWCGLRFEVAVKRHLRPETRCRCAPRSSSLLTKRLRSEAPCRRLVERVHEDHRLADVEEIEASDVLDETGTEAATLIPSPLEVTQMSAPVRRRSLPRRVPPKGIPRGWFQIGWSSDFTTDKPVSLHFFNCDLVAYRGQGTAESPGQVWVPTVRHNGELMPERITKLWVHQQHSQLESDPLIWANQTYIDRPPFLKFEAEPMRAFRSWSAKWYSA
jgi:hypothetical protein